MKCRFPTSEVAIHNIHCIVAFFPPRRSPSVLSFTMTVYTEPQYVQDGVAHFPRLSAMGVGNAFSWGAAAKNMTFSFGDKVAAKIANNKFFTTCGFGRYKDAVVLHSENSDRLLHLSAEEIAALKPTAYGRFARCDALFTSARDQVLAVKPADCTVATIYVEKSVGSPAMIGLVHAGWRGADKRLPFHAAKYLIDTLKIDPARIHIGLTPALRKGIKRFQHADEFHDKEAWGVYMTQHENDFTIDESGYVLSQYLEAGVPEANIEVYRMDTYAAHARGESFSELYSRDTGATQGRFLVTVRM